MHDFSTEYRLTDGSTTFSQEEWINDIKAQARQEGFTAGFALANRHEEHTPYRQGEVE